MIQPIPAVLPSFTQGPCLAIYELTRAGDLRFGRNRPSVPTDPAEGELDARAAIELVRQLAAFSGPPALEITGGDVLLRPDLYDLVHAGASAGMEVTLAPRVTTSLTIASMERLWRAGLARLAVELEGPDAASHDAATGVPGSYRLAQGIIRDALILPLPIEVRTVLKPSVRFVNRMAQSIAGLGIALWSVDVPVAGGAGGSDSRITPEQCEELFEALWLVALHEPYSVRLLNAPHFRRYILEREGGFPAPPEGRKREGVEELPAGMNDGKGMLRVGPNGSIHPGRDTAVTCGRFPENTLQSIYSDSPVFRSLRDSGQLKGKCGRCEYAELCGGSRARALAAARDLLAADPCCAYRPGITPSAPVRGKTLVAR